VPQDTVFYEKIERIFELKSDALVMGILNVTSDSFYDGGKYQNNESQLLQCKRMIDEGVDIIDIGAYSTRPNAKDIPEEDETKQLCNAIQIVRKNFPNILISADTFRATVAEKAIVAGANIINDISGGTMDRQMFETIARLKVPYILMHILGTPQTMQKSPNYNDVNKEVFAFFEEQLKKLELLGVKQVIIDLGFGFGKTIEHNYELLNNLNKFHKLGKPILVGLSRKSMIYKTLNINTKESLNGTTILNTIAIQKGAKLLRVHDVKEAKEVITLTRLLNP